MYYKYLNAKYFLWATLYSSFGGCFIIQQSSFKSIYTLTMRTLYFNQG